MVVIGVMGNGFIVLANGLDWIRSKRMSPSDMILTALSLTRLLYLGLILGTHCLFLIDVDNFKILPEPVVFLWEFINATTFWMTACLAAFYCIKLVNLPHVFFVKMKLHISWLVPRLLLGSVLVSLFISLPIIRLAKCSHCCNETSVVRRNGNMRCLSKTLSGVKYIVCNSPSFIIVLASSVVLIRSLLQHAQKMRQNAGGLKDYQMDALIKAVKTLLSFAIFFSASFVAMVSLATLTSPWTTVTSIIVITAYNSGHSVILIATNPKLKLPLIRGIQDIIGCGLKRTLVEKIICYKQLRTTSGSMLKTTHNLVPRQIGRRMAGEPPPRQRTALFGPEDLPSTVSAVTLPRLSPP
uniref:taste receptor type 2 member 4-like n=1 Tax=Euleptes europaea TaxID=460621 RepID=UPI002540A06B|nr:taste receptor type 2 member 4-like [Euleptes europaea]